MTVADPGFPFAAIVGQEAMVRALLLNAVDPRIGGLLIRGEKGTAKSTVARALADLVPMQRVTDGCAYGCDPGDPITCDADHHNQPDLPATDVPMRVVNLPINATEDRLVGSLDLRAALGGEGVRFQPGLLAAANRNILYVDEVNLLPDHLIDLVLDAAAMGRNTVEREGISVQHPARFLLIGTMNPEEGDLRPQLLDRFGLCVDVGGIIEIDARVEVMRRRAAFERDPAAFAARWEPEQSRLRQRVVAARALLPTVTLDDAMLRLIAGIAIDLGVDGHRADLVMQRAAAAVAAMDGRDAVTHADVREAAQLALPHRTRRRPFEQERFTQERLDDAIDRHTTPLTTPSNEPHPSPSSNAHDSPQQVEQSADAVPPDAPPDQSATPPEAVQADADADTPSADAPPQGEPHPQPTAPPPAPPGSGLPLALPALTLPRDRTPRAGAGRRLSSPTSDARGRAVGAVAATDTTGDIAVGATLRAAAIRTASTAAPRSDTVSPAQDVSQRRSAEIGAPLGRSPAVRTAAAQPARRSAGVATVPDGEISGPGSRTSITAPASNRHNRGAGTVDPISAVADAAARATTTPLLTPADLRQTVRQRSVGATIIFAVDTSGSMGAQQRIAAVRGAAATLLTEAYERRDRVALIAFRGTAAEVALPPTASVETVNARLAALPTGGRTPLAAAIEAVLRLIRQVRLKDPRALCVPVLLTDGKANVSLRGLPPMDDALETAAHVQQPGVYPLVLDTEPAGAPLGLAQRLADRAGATYVRLPDLTPAQIAATVQAVAASGSS